VTNFVQTEISTILQENDHFLSRVLMEEIQHSAIKSATDHEEGKAQYYERLGSMVMKLHGDPASLFLSSLTIEIKKIENYAAVMRERTMAVRVLQYIWAGYDVTDLLSPLYDFLRRLTKSKMKRLTLDIEKQHDYEIKEELVKAVGESLRVENLPKMICSICFKYHNLITKGKEDESAKSEGNHNSIRWAIGSFIFLRYLTPTVTSVASNPESSDFEKKGSVLLSRFLMKLSSHSRFSEYPMNSIVSVALQDCEPIFERFCDDVSRIGKDCAEMPFSELGNFHLESVSERDSSTLSELNDFLTTFGKFSGFILQKHSDSADTTELIDSLRGRLKRKLLEFHKMYGSVQ